VAAVPPPRKLITFWGAAALPSIVFHRDHANQQVPGNTFPRWLACCRPFFKLEWLGLGDLDLDDPVSTPRVMVARSRGGPSPSSHSSRPPETAYPAGDLGGLCHCRLFRASAGRASLSASGLSSMASLAVVSRSGFRHGLERVKSWGRTGEVARRVNRGPPGRVRGVKGKHSWGGGHGGAVDRPTSRARRARERVSR